MSSKLCKKYSSLKAKNPDYCYLFKSGIFYIFISDDAKKIAPLLDLKITYLNPVTIKCGFPINCSEKYFKKLKDLNINIQVIDSSEEENNIPFEKFVSTEEFTEIIDNFLNVNIDNLSIPQAFDLLTDLQNKFKIISKKRIA